MSNAHRYLTKSKFKLALECPTKLFYTGKKEYFNRNLEDSFLESLAEGGYQVGELAKLYFPGGIDIHELDHETALQKTETLLKSENVIIYEPAFRHDSLFIRVDILVKSGNKIDLIEVKAKSYKPDERFKTQSGGIVSKWKPYLYDVAFQKYVLSLAHPELIITPVLCLVDKTKVTTVEGLNQRFSIEKVNGRTQAKVNGDNEDLGDHILGQVNVTEEVESIINNEKEDFPSLVESFQNNYVADEVLFDGIGGKCAKCEFQANDQQLKEGYLSGHYNCWKTLYGLSDEDISRPSVNLIWDFRKKDRLIDEGRLFLDEVTETDLGLKTSADNGLSRTERQQLQIQRTLQNDESVFLLKEELRAEIDSCKYPLHFIDFETSTVAIPFNSGRRPYEQIAFQFSHHVVHEDGSVRHQGEWINSEKGNFPNFDFVRDLKAQLENDDGSIFRYAPHENTILCAIIEQLESSHEIDKHDLIEWIKSITTSTHGYVDAWVGDRNMIDMHKWVLKYFYHVSMKGSNSIKAVLPSVLNTSEFLKEKYSKPIYGTEIPSLNFKDQTLVEFDVNGLVKNPYSQLPSIFEGVEKEQLDSFVGNITDGISDGGSAMMAYAKMQFSEVTDIERDHLQKALLRYCELDTMAMVMIWEAWKNWIK